MFKAWMQRRSTTAMLAEMDQYLRFLRASTDEEIAVILLASALTRELLLTSKSIKGQFPSDILNGMAVVEDATRTDLLLYAIELGSLQSQCHAAGSNPAVAVVASGAVVWKNSVRALAVTELFAPGREIWTELLRGQAFVLPAFEDMQAMGALGQRQMPEMWFPGMLIRQDKN